jgi:ABC-type glutathione transport system ATPase component
VDRSTESLAKVRELTVIYSSESGEPVRALDAVGIDVHSGEIVGILGESGSGKSTLANAMLRLLAPHARCEGGTILFRGRDLMNLSQSELRAIRGRDISLIPQDPALALNPVMTTGAQIDEVLRALATQRPRAPDTGPELLREVGFDHVEEIYSAYPHQLSGGQRQRIAIAQAVACRPSLLIADESTSKLDATLQAEIVSLLAQIRRQHGTAILVIIRKPALRNKSYLSADGSSYSKEARLGCLSYPLLVCMGTRSS